MADRRLVIRRGWVWDGAAWLEIAASPVVSYLTEAALLADTTKPSGVFGIAASTGAMYAKVTGGWKYVGIKEYATTAALLADAPSAGALGVAGDDSSLWERTSTGWRCLTIRELADTAAVVAWAGTADCHNGDRAIDLLHGCLHPHGNRLASNRVLGRHRSQYQGSNVAVERSRSNLHR